jgi:geranylgeranyl reductase family protein
MKDTHVAIVGAGPSGAWAAYSLARRGLRVTLIDPSHPREKPCGGGVTGRSLALVAPALTGRALPASTVRAARFMDATTGASATVELSDDETGLQGREGREGLEGLEGPPDLVVASRRQFDGALVAAATRAGADLQRSRVTDIAVESDGVSIQMRDGAIRAGYVIGADGANSLVRRRVAAPFERRQLSVATGYFAYGVTSREIVIEFVADPPGYIWSFPRPDHLAIGICAQADAGVGADALRQVTAAWIERTGIARGARLQPYSWPIPSLAADDFRNLPLAGSRWCVVGDAAGLVDPITREGIFFALLSAQWAAETLAEGLDLSGYGGRVRRDIVPELERAARLRSMFFTARFIGLLMSALQQSESVRAVMADLIAGRQPYATLKWRLLKTFELGLALRYVARSLQASDAPSAEAARYFPR